jgi:hypothetical protein
MWWVIFCERGFGEGVKNVSLGFLLKFLKFEKVSEKELK